MQAILFPVFIAVCFGINAQAVSVSPNASSVVPTNASIRATAGASTNLTVVNSTVKTTSTTASSSTRDTCWGKKNWNSDLVDVSCNKTECAVGTFDKLTEFMACNEKTESKELNEIAESVYYYASQLAAEFKNAPESSVHGNGSKSFITKHFLVEIGFLNRQRSDLRILSTVPDYRKAAASSYSGKKDSFTFAMLTLNQGVTAYYVVLYKDLISPTELMTFESEKPNIVEKLKGYTWPTTRSGKWVLNSQVVRIGFTPSPDSLTEPIEVTFQHIELIKRINHDCIALPGNLDNTRIVWSTAGCHKIYTDRYKTVCRCSSPGVFAVISQIEEVNISSKPFSRTSITLVAAALSIFIIIGLAISICYPLIKGYVKLLRVQIYIFHDAATLMVYFLFVIGVTVSDNIKYADSVAGSIHFFQTAVISWIFVEGIHNYHLLYPIYDPEVTSATFFYNTIGWGIPAALSGACAGYPYELEPAEFSWMKVSGSGMKYFVVGPLASVLAVLVVYGLIFYELRSWIGSKRDYEYRKCMEYYKRSSMLLFVTFLTWYTGIMARNNTATLFYSYLFLAMYGTQGGAIIYLHFLRNTEIAEYRSKQRLTRVSSPARNTEAEDISMNADDLASSQTSMRSLINRRSKAPSRQSEARPESAKSLEQIAETKFDGTDSEDMPNSSPHSTDDSSSSSDSSDEDGVDKTPSEIRGDFSVYQIDEEEEYADGNSEKTDRGSSSAPDIDNDNGESNDLHEEQLQRQGYQREGDGNDEEAEKDGADVDGAEVDRSEGVDDQGDTRGASEDGEEDGRETERAMDDEEDDGEERKDVNEDGAEEEEDGKNQGSEDVDTDGAEKAADDGEDDQAEDKRAEEANEDDGENEGKEEELMEETGTE